MDQKPMDRFHGSGNFQVSARLYADHPKGPWGAAAGAESWQRRASKSEVAVNQPGGKKR